MEPFNAVALYAPEEERARRWSVAAALPAANAASNVVAVPPFHLALTDTKTIGLRDELVSARVYSFSGTCAGGATAPVLVEPLSNVTDEVGVAALALTLDTTGCTAGTLVVEIYTPHHFHTHKGEPRWFMRSRRGVKELVNARKQPIERYAQIVLYEDGSASYSDAVSLASRAVVDNHTEAGVATAIEIKSTLHQRSQRTTINQTTYRYVDAARTLLDNTTSVVSVSDETTSVGKMMILLKAPPSGGVGVREDFDVIVQVMTEHGLPVPGAWRRASPRFAPSSRARSHALFAPSAARRRSRTLGCAGALVSTMMMSGVHPIRMNGNLAGVLQAYTDASGVANLTMHFRRGRSGQYTLLFSTDVVLDALRQPGGLTSVVSRQATELQNQIASAALDVATSQLAGQANTARDQLLAAVQTSVQADLVSLAEQASAQATTQATNCILASTGSIAGASTSTVLTGGSTTALTDQVSTQVQSCVTNAINSQLAGLSTSVTQTLVTSINDLADPTAAFAIDTTTIRAQLDPLLQQTVVTAINQIPGLSELTSLTSLPRNATDLIAAAYNVARALWSLLPLPAPVAVTLINGLDTKIPGQDKAPPSRFTGRSNPNGVTFRAPLTGFALSESSAATNLISGMSSCTLDGYIRYEPSPSGQNFLLSPGVLGAPGSLFPEWQAGNTDEAQSYWSSALWQPFPFNNFVPP